MTEHPIRLGISRCLLGEPVRYDGGHKRDRFLTDVLGRYVEWVPVCPEVEAGFGTPREAMRLEGERGKLRIMEPHPAACWIVSSPRHTGIDRKIWRNGTERFSWELLPSKRPDENRSTCFSIWSGS